MTASRARQTTLQRLEVQQSGTRNEIMGILLALRRFCFRIVATIFFGPCYSSFLHWMTSAKPLAAEETWNHFTRPKGRIIEWFMNHYPPPILTHLFIDLYYRRSFKFKDHAIGISQHYDLSNCFYELFLDKGYMFYSCGDFSRDTDTLEDAQQNKADYLLNLIDPKSGERILDLGPGWGAMLKAIYEKTGDKENLYGYTLSREQKRYTDEKYGFRVEYRDFINTEYAPKSFDKIFSIETMEHVRPSELPLLAMKLARALKPNGKIIHQFFCQLGDVPPPHLRVAGLEIFPGSELSSLKKHLNSFEKANLKITHHSVHDYRPTLKAWFDGLVANKESAIRLVGIRNYNKYLCYFAEAWRLFNDRDLILMRFVLEPRAA
jgi:cyclopropane-fatty-acyl-phospholipid synthase